MDAKSLRLALALLYFMYLPVKTSMFTCSFKIIPPCLNSQDLPSPRPTLAMHGKGRR